MPCFIGVGEGLDVLSLSHFMKSECEPYPQFMKSGCGGRGGFFTTEYTEAVEPYLKDTETGLEGLVSVWERSDLSVYSVVKIGWGVQTIESC